MKVVISKKELLNLKILGKNEYEVNGQISVENGKITDVKHQIGQMMDPCWTGCTINFHTHPPDYENLYPDHPSTTDYIYIHRATCTMKELSSHMVITPKYVYVIWYKCPNILSRIANIFVLQRKIENIFAVLSEMYDRSTEDFRQAYMNEMRKLGFHIDRFEYNKSIELDLPESGVSYLTYVIIVIIMLVALRRFFL